ncbi:phospholipase D [Metschnikowia bicuspidata var. bicuspidata NRRL YB-4993]|uniref:Phospholipase D1 n=1 Tax=Metschnikowia bicuspidata var. bicuspidata NRRL YB-4993 TaxID=869754 RepID=A0A1A0H832_9ASCO|nr:phospholipase D [Metschnikowia bicuspidata var. bicuspidata NRRL YB-4993]OBA20145.1 phospholipase D [Metschnikowia bicuspidata var. bicuspidata NRRL YB-4993]
MSQTSLLQPLLNGDLLAEDFNTPNIALPNARDHKRTSSLPEDQHSEDQKQSQDQRNLGKKFAFLGRRGDPNESRYDSENRQHEGDTKMPFKESDMRRLEDDVRSEKRSGRGEAVSGDRPTISHKRSLDGTRLFGSQHFSALRRPTTIFGRAPPPAESSLPKPAEGVSEDARKPRKIFTLFRKKNKDKDRWPGIADVADTESLNEDRETGERAQGLVGSLFLGSPAMNLLASCLCEDEYGIARAPLLMNLIGIKVTDISRSPLTKNKKFRIDLEYGVWPQRLKWSVEKTAKDLLYLHSKFKWLALRGSLKSVNLPKYPVPPLLRRNERRQTRHSKFSGETSQTPAPLDTLPTVDSRQHDNNSILSGQSFHDRFSALRAHFSSDSDDASLNSASPEQLRTQIQSNQNYVREIEKYLNDLNVLVAMRAQSNRLFQFFELSPISSLLSYETGYIGKQGVIHVGGTAKSQGWRVGHFKANDIKEMIDRRSEKWFLVRGSYVMYVSEINSTTPIEVFIVDSSFKLTFKRENNEKVDAKVMETESDFEEELEKSIGSDGKALTKVQNKVFKHLRIVLENNERKLVIIPKSKAEQQLWISSLNEMVKSNVWAEKHRFNSFAPIRKNCYAQWLVDARDYFWALSSALEMAKDVIFIHDWWLSPELYLRRPANGNQQFRLDRVLQRKAQQGVKIFVILYRNVGTTIPIDSLYSKHSILSLNQENVHVIRSPNQLLQNTYFWAHHEKLCVIDYNVAFMGGIDLCYGRYDTPDHVLADDSPTDFATLDPENYNSEDLLNFRVFSGKDYSNTRVKDFNNLSKPYESLYDRNVVPRMPWHDVHMMTSGEVARDLARHFVQRWNYLLRQKRPSRLTPLLTPPPDLTEEQVKEMNLDGTCEIQVLRSSGSWSLGLKEHEQSIQQAYLKLIETSEHFIYIENQFFVTSCFIDGTEVKNRIGDALVDRIIRAHREGKSWKAIILIPLVPGFESQVDQIDGSSVRVVMQCEYMSISRGSSSLFAKLRKAGIDPDDYIQFFSLRKWGSVGPDRTLVTEQLYIHAKLMIADDRAAIIGSANINERSMRGSRDSELAALIRDTDTIDSMMNGEPYKVGKFVHSLRLRLMREHLGVAVDLLDIVERRFEAILKFARTKDGVKAATDEFSSTEKRELSAAVEFASRLVLQETKGTTRWKSFCRAQNIESELFEIPRDIRFEEAPPPMSLPLSFNNRTGPHEANVGIRDSKKHSFDPRVQANLDHQRDVFGEGTDKYRANLTKRARLDSAKFLRNLSRDAMEKYPDKAFLPNIQDVKDFLNLDDSDLKQRFGDNAEDVLFNRNLERWLLLKKVAYLQLVAAKDAKQTEKEAEKRVKAGLTPVINNFESKNSQSVSSTESGAEMENIKFSMTAAVNIKNNNATPGEEFDITPERDTSEAPYQEMNPEQVPIVTLDNDGFRDTIRKINLPGAENFTKFIDPFSFSDPLDPDFYEDIWYENARRNTDIFRLIFHCQPDDTVPSWKEYMHFMKLSKGFKVAQDGDAKARKEKPDNDSADRQGGDYDNFRRSSHTTININDYQEENGILGDIPSGNSEDEHTKSDVGRRGFKPEETIPENGESDGEITDEDGKGHSADFQDHVNGAKRVEKMEGAEFYKFRDVNGSGNEKEVSGDAYRSEAEALDPKVPPKFGPNNSYSRRGGGKTRAGTFSARRKLHAGDKIFERDSAERILQEVHGHLVLFPVDWLERELEGGNWFFNTDRIPPIEIYN